MIDIVDSALKTLLEGQVAGLTVGFDAPDSTWRAQVAQAGGNWLNVYLIEFRENRKLRSNEWVDDVRDGQVVRTPVPARLDCHYLVSAWTRAGISPTPLIEATIDESVVLYDAARVLLNNGALDVRSLYAGASPVPPELVERPLPTTVAPPEGFAKLPDFWNRMDWVWKPVVELVVTVPVAAAARTVGVPVTTLLAELLQDEQPGSAEEFVLVGGVVRAGAPLAPIQGAWVRIVELDRLASTDGRGRFVFERIARGLYRFEAGARGHPVPTVRLVEVPSTSGEYDVVLV